MKHIKKTVLISLLSLTLMSCNSTSSSNTENKPNTENPVTEFKPATDTLGAITDAPVTDLTTDTPPDTSGVSTESSSVTPDEEEWGEKISTEMKKHLGGVVLPYVDLGRNVEGNWDRTLGDYGVYTILGGTFNKKYFDDATTAFEAKGWIVTKNAVTLTAELSDKHLHVELTSDQYNYAKMTATFDEPFDPTSVTEWDADTLDSMHASLGGHELPFIYMGMAAPTTNWDNAKKTFTIAGGKWDDQVLDLALTALTNAKFTNVKKTKEGSLDMVKGEFAFEDGSAVTVSLYKSGTTEAPCPFLSVFFKEAYNPVDGATWPTDIKEKFKDDFHEHMIPYVYLGTDSLSFVSSLNGKKLTITGGVFDDRMFLAAKTAFAADGFDCVDEKGAGGKQKSLITSKKMSDNCTLVAVLYGNETLAKIDVFYYVPLDVPSDTTAFDDVVKGQMDKYLVGHSADVPFVYLGADQLDIAYDSKKDVLNITGGDFNGIMIDNAKKAFADKGYTVSITSEYYYGRALVATKTFSDQTTVTAKIASNYGKKSAVLTLSAKEGFNPPAIGSTEAAWSDKIKEAMELELGGNVLPYFYLGTKSPVLVQSKNTIELTGGTWDKRVLTFAKDALKSMTGFTWTLKGTSEAFEGEGVDASNNKLVVSMSKDDKGKPYFKARFQKVFAVPENGAWSEAIKTEMTKDFGEVLPYVYLAATDPECGEFYNGALEISGGNFDDQIYALAADAFTKAGYTVSEGTSYSESGSRMVTAYKATDTKLFRIAVYDYYGTATYKVCADAAAAYPSDVTAWKDTVKSKMNEYMGASHTIPFFYTGDNTPSISQSTFDEYMVGAGSKEYLEISRLSKWNDFYTLNAENVLKKAGWHTTFYAMMDDYVTGAMLVATYAYDDGATVSLTIKAGSSANTIYIAYQDPFTVGTETTWTPSIINSMESNFNGHTLPYFYMGTDTPEWDDQYYDYTHSRTIYGKIWNDKIYALAEAAFKADTELTWSIHYDYSFVEYTSNKALVAVAEEKDTGKHFTVKLYHRTSGSYHYGIEVPYLEIFYN